MEFEFHFVADSASAPDADPICAPRRSSLFLQALDSLVDHVAILDDRGVIIAVNSAWIAFARENGLTTPRFGVGINYLELCDSARGPHATEAPFVADQLRLLLAHKQHKFRCEYPCHSPRQQRWFQLCGTAFEANSRFYILLSHQCITPVKEAERAVHESEQRYRSLLDLAPDAVLVHQDRRVVYANRGAVRLFGLASAEQLIGQDLLNFTPQSDHAMVTERVLAALAEGHCPLQEYTVNRADGAHISVESQAGLIAWEGRPALQAIMRDITRRKQQELLLRLRRRELETLVRKRTAQLREAIDELEHFSYALIHDLRTPLRAIMGFAGVLQAKLHSAPSAELETYLNSIQRAGERMDYLVQDALNYSKVLRQSFPLRPVELRPLLENLLASYPVLHAHGACIELAPHLPSVLGNESALTECFSNLLRNAVTFVAPGVTPRVRVYACPGGELTRICVQDNGLGIPASDREKIFSMFQRLHHAETYPGTGIGLAIARKAVERMGGNIGVDSQPGAGSTFWVELRPAQAARVKNAA